MSSGEDSDDYTDAMMSENGSYSFMPHTESGHNRTGTTQPNVYTPLGANPPPHLQLSTLDCNEDSVSVKDETAASQTSNDKTCAIKTKTNISPRCPVVKNQRSSVRPFFCCGSELSLVSLVDGIELKEQSCNSRKLQSIECSSSSDDESPETSPFRGRSNSVSSGESHRPGTARRKKKEKHVVKTKFWSLRLQKKWSSRWRSRRSQLSKCPRDLSQQSVTSGITDSHTHNASGSSACNRQMPAVLSVSRTSSPSPLFDLFNLFPVEDITEAAQAALRRRAEEIPVGRGIDTHALSRAIRSNVDVSGSVMDLLRIRSRLSSTNSDAQNSLDSPIEDLLVNNLILQAQNPRLSIESWGNLSGPPIHTQIDYVHYLVPDLTKVTSCSYYWGVMDRYEAEHLLENKPPGTFLLRDSAQEDFLFSVSFRRYNRSLHARIEQWNHRFSFDAHDPNVFSASTVFELMEHYKDPSLCMFFEPMLTRPLHRNFPFSLQHMCRTVICDRISYDDIQALPIPNSFKTFLQTYHYKQKVRVRRFDAPEFASAESRVVN